MGIEEELQKILEERNTVGSKVGQIIKKIKNGEETTGDPLKKRKINFSNSHP